MHVKVCKIWDLSIKYCNFPHKIKRTKELEEKNGGQITLSLEVRLRQGWVSNIWL